MLTLTLKGNAIPLPVDFSMRLTWKSPVCNFEKIPSGYGLGISIPINEYTRALFGNPERFTKRRTGNDQKFTGFEIRFSGALLMAGTLTITGFSMAEKSGTSGSYECSLTDQVGILGEKEQERDILEIPKFTEVLNWQNVSDYSPDTHPYCCFPIQNSFFFKGKGVSVTRTIKDAPDPDNPGKVKDITYETEVMQFCYLKSVAGLVNAKNVDNTIKTLPSTIDLQKLTQKNNTYESGEVSVVSPFFYLNYIIKNALKDSGFFVQESAIDDDTVIRKICIYNNYDITQTTYENTGEWIISLDLPGTGNFEFPVPLTIYQSTGVRIHSYKRLYDNPILIQPKNHLPKMKVGDLLISTQNLFNIIFFFKPNNTADILNRELILTANEAIDLDSYILGVWLPGEKKNVALKFIREHDNNDALFSEEYTDLSDRRADIKPTVATYTLLLAVADPKEGDIRYCTEARAFYEYKWITNSDVDPETYDTAFTDVFGWKKMSIGLQNGWYNYGREEVEEIKTDWSACPVLNTAEELKAIVRQNGNMNSWKSKQQAFSPRLLIQSEGTNGGSEIPELSFEYEKPVTGLFAKYWKNWNPFWANRLAVTGNFDLPVNVLRHVIYNICNKYRTREGEFLIEEMSCDLYIDHIGTTEIKGFKVE